MRGKRLVVALLPLVLVTTTWRTGVLMGLVVMVAAVAATWIFGLIQHYLPPASRLACQIIVVGTLIGLVDLWLTLLYPERRQQLGIYLPLATVSCLLLVSEALEAGLSGFGRAIRRAVSAGGGYLGLLLLVGGLRELLGRLNPLALTSAGGFLSFGLLLGVIATLSRRVGSERAIAGLFRRDAR